MTGVVKKVLRLFPNPPTEINGERQKGNLFINALKQWTGKSSATVIFDSTVDEFTNHGLFNKIKGKHNVAFVGFTTEGDVFGGFYSVAVTNFYDFFHDPNLFAFSFESHGRCKTPQRFVVKQELRHLARVRFFKGDDFGQFVQFDGPGWFYFGNEKSRTYCHLLSAGFEGIKDTTLTGTTGVKYTCYRLIAILLE